MVVVPSSRRSHADLNGACDILRLTGGELPYAAHQATKRNRLGLKSVRARVFAQTVGWIRGQHDEPGVAGIKRLPVRDGNDQAQRQPANVVLVNDDRGPYLGHLGTDRGIEID